MATTESCVGLQANDLVQMRLTVKVNGLRWWWIRVMVGVAIVRLAAAVLPGKVEVALGPVDEEHGPD